MLTTQVALVPLEPQGDTFNRQLLLVAASLQTQVVRDFAPIWGASAVVAPFLSLEEVPPEYFPVIVSDEELPGDHHGFHLATGGRPFALVHLEDGWSVAASHELLELVVDPDGTRTMSGRSIADRCDKAWKDGGRKGPPPVADYRRQGTVDYFRELCDPVEPCTYEINGVMVSDFVTPGYYDDLGQPGRVCEPDRDCDPARVYSFLGSVTEPFQIVKGGYLSWRTREPRNSVWQAFGPAVADDGSGDACAPAELDQLDIRRLSDLPPGTPPLHEQAFRDDVEEVVKLLKTPSPTLRDLIGLFEEIHMGAPPTADLFSKYHVEADPEDRAAFDNPEKRASLPKILDLLRQQERMASLLGTNVSDPGLGGWTRYLMP